MQLKFVFSFSNHSSFEFYIIWSDCHQSIKIYAAKIVTMWNRMCHGLQRLENAVRNQKFWWQNMILISIRWNICPKFISLFFHIQTQISQRIDLNQTIAWQILLPLLGRFSSFSSKENASMGLNSLNSMEFMSKWHDTSKLLVHQYDSRLRL